MEIKEAIWRIKDHFRVHDDGRPTPFLDEAVKMAIEALKKQVETEKQTANIKPCSILKECEYEYSNRTE